MTGWIDTHTHLNDQAYQGELEKILERMAQAGVDRAVVVGFDLPSSQKAVELAHLYPQLYAAVGVHPHDAKDYTDETGAELRRLLRESKVVALGEVGLDYHYDHSPRGIQQEVFRRQIRLAREQNMPLIIHDRESTGDLMAILREEQANEVGGVFHCFSGSVETAREALAMKFYISIAGPVTFANARRLPEVILEIPADRLLVETDCPYLTPHPYRGKRNEPAYVAFVGREVARILGVSPEELAHQTAENAGRCFCWNPMGRKIG